MLGNMLGTESPTNLMELGFLLGNVLGIMLGNILMLGYMLVNMLKDKSYTTKNTNPHRPDTHLMRI